MNNLPRIGSAAYGPKVSRIGRSRPVAAPGKNLLQTLTVSILALWIAMLQPRPAPAANVYVVLSSDTSIWNTISGGLRVFENEFNFRVFTRRDAVMAGIFDPEFRAAHVDSAGQPFKITWFMLGGAYFTSGINTNSISTTYLIRRFWEPQILRDGDEVAYHFHHYNFTGSSWDMADTFLERTWDFDWTFSQALIDQSLYTVSFRSGWNYIDTPYENYLEAWIPFRLEGGGWMKNYVPYHPSFANYRQPGTMKGWEARHIYTKSFTPTVAGPIFAAAEAGQDQVVCIWSHENESDFVEQMADVDQVLQWAWADHPGAPFFYLTAREAMVRFQLGEAGEASEVGEKMRTDNHGQPRTNTDSATNPDADGRPAMPQAQSAPRRVLQFAAPPTRQSVPKSVSPSVSLSVSSAATTQTIVADNDFGPPDYTETGTWGTSSSVGYNGGTYRFRVAGSASTATWIAHIPEAGYYDLYNAFLPGSNRANRVRYVVRVPGGDEEIFVNQNGSGPVVERFMGRFLLEAGDLSVTLDAAGSQGATGSMVISDALLFHWAIEQAPLPLDRIVVDNDAGPPAYTETGSWTLSSTKGFNGGVYRYANAGAASTATWNALIPRAGYYDGYAAFLPGANRVELARFVIHGEEGDQAFYVNQRGSESGGVEERLIGRSYLAPGAASVTLDAAGSVGYAGTAVISDAVVFLWADEQVPLPSPTPTPSPTPSPTPPPTITPLPPLPPSVLAPPLLQLSPITRDTRTTVTIVSDPGIYPVQPWVAIRTYQDEYSRLDATPLSPGRWVFSYDNTQVDTAVVGVCDIRGNTAIAEPRDGSRRISTQSEFDRCHPRNIDTLTRANQATLEKTEGAGAADAYVTSGTLLYTFDARRPVHWTGTRVEGAIPAGTFVRVRCRFADQEAELAGRPWTPYYDAPLAQFPDPPLARMIQCEILLESDSTATPVLEAFEVLYQTPDPMGQTSLILF